MPLIGYGRVSSRGQSLDVQMEKLREAGCDKIYAEKKSGLEGKRQELGRCLDYMREGDVLVVTRLDRLARSTIDLYAILGRLKDKGAGFRCLDNPEMDTTTKHGKLLIGILSLIAEFEIDIKKERQLDGIVAAKERGVKFGRQPTVSNNDVERMKAMRKAGVLIKDLQAEFNLSKSHVYRLLAA